MAAPNIIEIDGRTFNKCHISRQQWNECITPCTFCHSIVQNRCHELGPYPGSVKCFSQGEHVCYIDLGAIYGEQ